MNIRYRETILVLLLLSSGCARKNFFSKTPVSDPAVYQALQANTTPIDSVTVQAGKHYKRSGFHNIFWGSHYRNVWAAPVTVPVFDLKTMHGGMEVEKKGGGFQTTSLTLASKSGMTYALRSLDKDPVAVVPKIWQKTFVANVLRDQTSAQNPYGAFIIPPLAEAVGVPHANPQLVYVKPAAKEFGEYEELISDGVYMIEEKYNDERALTPMLGDAVDIVGSKKVLNNRFGDDDHFIDQLAFAKARLLDIFINDWDRHEGQWEWAKYEPGEENVYRPIPKDRDNAFFRFQNGLIPWIFSRNWAIRKFESFDDEYNDVKALAINSKFIDDRALNMVTRAQFDSLAKEMQRSLTDNVIETGVKRLPPSVYKLVSESTTQKLKNRRDQLDKAAAMFYKVLAEEVLVVGTDMEETFEVKRLNDEETEVSIVRKSDKKQVYHRIFKTSETKEIKLYGLAEDDKFKLSGEVNKGIKISIIGGRGEDEIKDKSVVKSGGKKTWVYDTVVGTELEGGPSTKDKRTSDVRVHAFDREGF